MMLNVQRLNDRAHLPRRAHADDAGYDLLADEAVTLMPHTWRMVHTGLAVDIPQGSVGLICPRSGLAFRHGVTVLNAPGIIDAGYRGEVGVLLMNHSAYQFGIQPGDRIAQLVIVPAWTGAVQEVDALDATDRGQGGFGSTGR
jgi:dUTP pyrophosphatase